MRIRRLPEALAILALAFAAPAQAQDRLKPGQRSVVGTVVDSATGRPLAAAVVAIGRREALTDSAGNFTLPRIVDGAAVLKVGQLGYGSRAIEVTVAGGMAPLAIALAPNPVLLRAITVMADRFRSRRDASPYSVRAFDRKDLLSFGSFNLRDFLLYRAGLVSGSCPSANGDPVFGRGFPSTSSFAPMGTGASLCARVRGQWVEPSIWIDDRHAFADELTTYSPNELFLVEVYGRGQMIRAYTTWWVAAMANRPLMPIFY